MVSQSKRLSGLDGLRAISALFVVAVHAAPRVEKVLPDWFRWICARGWFGVDIFFVLSGFLITHLLIKEEKDTGRISLKNFYLRRAFRILPPAFFYLAFIGAIAWLGGLTCSVSEIVASMFFFRNLMGYDGWYTAHFWSLAIEEQFYLLWPFLFVVIPTRRRLLSCVTLCLFAPAWKAANYLVYGGANVNSLRFDFHYDGLLTGAALSMLWGNLSLRAAILRRLSGKSWLLLVAGALILITLLAEAREPRLSVLFGPFRYWCVALAIFILVSGTGGSIGAVLNWRPITWMGAISYSLYLWQQFTIGLAPRGSGRAVLFGIAMAFACAALSYFWIETPALMIRRRFGGRDSSEIRPSLSAEASDC